MRFRLSGCGRKVCPGRRGVKGLDWSIAGEIQMFRFEEQYRVERKPGRGGWSLGKVSVCFRRRELSRRGCLKWEKDAERRVKPQSVVGPRRDRFGQWVTVISEWPRALEPDAALLPPAWGLEERDYGGWSNGAMDSLRWER